MREDDLSTAITERLEKLTEAREQQRKADDEVKRLKVELSELSVKFAITQRDANTAAFSDLVNTAMDAW